MKKVATLLAALMLMTAAFAGCGDTGSNSSAAETSTSSTVSETSASESESSAEAAGDETSSEASAAETGDYGEFTTVEEGKLIMATNAQFLPHEMVADGEGFKRHRVLRHRRGKSPLPLLTSWAWSSRLTTWSLTPPCWPCRTTPPT